MKRREFVNKTGVIAVGIGALPLISCADTAKKAGEEESVTNFTLPDLPYAFDALAPNIDARTMEIHHDKHHAGYVRKLNAALQDHSLAGKSLAKMMASIKDVDSDIGVRNNGGGHYNHSMFWEVMKPGGSDMSAELMKAINTTFGSKADFESAFGAAAKTRFGSGWAWLCVDKDNKLYITSTPNQDNPLMVNVVEKPGTPIMGIDVWEHAYYLNYQNKRGDYVTNWNNVINWEKVSENYKNAIG
jgi:Fe-Mn family superoxide dismutase